MSRKKYIDLHYHLDGSITPAIARQLAAMQGILLPAREAKLRELLTVTPDCRDLNEFLEKFELPISLTQTPQALAEAVYLEQEELKREGVVYAEIRLAPQQHTQKGMTQRQAVEAALKGLHRSDLAANLILCCMRGSDTQAANLETIELAREFLVENDGVTAVDLAGAEALFFTGDYRELFRRAKEYGIPFTIHAGEADGAASIRCAVEMGATRIGHGVRLYEDPGLLAKIRDRGITLEMCPTSNYYTKAIPDMRDYPLKSYLEAGVRVALCTDDKAICGTDIAREFAYARETLKITEEQEEMLYLNAVSAAFTDAGTKEWLKS